MNQRTKPIPKMEVRGKERQPFLSRFFFHFGDNNIIFVGRDRYLKKKPAFLYEIYYLRRFSVLLVLNHCIIFLILKYTYSLRDR